MTIREIDELNNVIVNIIGFIFTILFIVAKVLGWINISWWWILIPIFLPGCYTTDTNNEGI